MDDRLEYQQSKKKETHEYFEEETQRNRELLNQDFEIVLQR